MAKKLLVADDSVTIQKVIRLALSNEGYEIQAVSDGNDTIQQIAVFRPNIVLIDISLPGKTAFEVKRAINAHQDLKDVRFVLMSSAFEKVDEIQAQEVEFHARLTKPFDPAHLREILTQVMELPTSGEEQSPSMALPARPPTEIADEPLFTSAPTPVSLPPAPSIPVSSPFEDFRMESLSGSALAASNSATPSSEDDIRQLTESTIRIAGIPGISGSTSDSDPIHIQTNMTPELLEPAMGASTTSSASTAPITSPPPATSLAQDDFEWSVQEPVLKPMPSVLRDEQESSFPLMEGLQAGASAYHSAPDEPVFSELLRAALGKASQPQVNNPPPPPRSIPVAPPPPPLPEGNPFFQAQEFLTKTQLKTEAPTTFSEKEIENLVNTKVEEKVQAKVNEAIQKMIRANLPDIIEKVVKEEIHRLLSEQL